MSDVTFFSLNELLTADEWFNLQQMLRSKKGEPVQLKKISESLA
jgi:hypothetical protein